MRDQQELVTAYTREHVGAAPGRAKGNLDLVAIEAAELEATAVVAAIHSVVANSRPSIDAALAAARVASAPTRTFVYHIVKRALDVVFGSILLVLFSPVIALVAILIRLDSRGPAIFVQERVGKNGEIFRFRKFRTMHVDARERFPELYEYQYSDEELPTMFFKLPHDPRSTRVGRRLRRTSLDELPNLINVLRGEMTLVGPRPEIPEMLPYYEPEQLCKFAVKPGLTGLAQVSGRNILRFVDTNAKDVEYVHARSLALDLTILWRTVGAVALMVGAH
jgi:lipopolysaccharide/colanic/teichoic acid biosynthesis glycosyltransferase